MKSKLKFIVPILLIVLGGVYKFVLAKPGAPAPKPKVDGQVYVLPKEFLINLDDGRFAKLSVGLVLDHDAGDRVGATRRRPSRRRASARCRRRP